MSVIKIRVAQQVDLNSIYEFLVGNFHDKDKMVPDNDFLSDCIKGGTTLIAFVENQFCGLLIAKENHANEFEPIFKCANEIMSSKSSDR